MFDFRYHVASLAAVFFAIVIGILVGVALASHGLGNTERKRLEEDLRRAESQAEVLRATVDSTQRDAAADHAFVEGTYKSVMANRLKGKKIAVLFIGSSEKVRRSSITSALADAGAGTPLRFRFVKVPVDPEAPGGAVGEEAVARELRRTGRAQEPRPRPWDRSSWRERTRRCGLHCRSEIVEETIGPSKTAGGRRRDRSHGDAADRSDRSSSSRVSTRASRTSAFP